MILYARRMVRRGHSYAVDSKRSIDLIILLLTCQSGTPFCQGLLLSTNDFVVVWTFHQVGERVGIHSVHSVVEDAVKQNSWRKSGSDWMCHFQNNGGLHRTSGDAPPETHDVRERVEIYSVFTNDFVC